MWKIIYVSRFLTNDMLSVVDLYMQRNAFPPPENILLLILVDERKEIRESAARRIKLTRQKATEKRTDNIRIFKIPTFSLVPSDYYDLVEWQDLERTQPPIMLNVRNVAIDNAIKIA